MCLSEHFSHIWGVVMSDKNINHKLAHYRVVKTVESVVGKPTAMYGIEGFCGDETVTVTALSENRRRIKELVNKLNESELSLCHFCEVVDNFLFEAYGIKRIAE